VSSFVASIQRPPRYAARCLRCRSRPSYDVTETRSSRYDFVRTQFWEVVTEIAVAILRETGGDVTRVDAWVACSRATVARPVHVVVQWLSRTGYRRIV